MVATNGVGKRALMWNNSSDRGKPARSKAPWRMVQFKCLQQAASPDFDISRRRRRLLVSVYYVHNFDAQGGTRHLPPPRRRTRQLLSGRGGCARGQTSCGLDAKRRTAASRVSEPAASR